MQFVKNIQMIIIKIAINLNECRGGDDILCVIAKCILKKVDSGKASTECIL